MNERIHSPYVPSPITAKSKVEFLYALDASIETLETTRKMGDRHGIDVYPIIRAIRYARELREAAAEMEELQ